ncbi:MAG: radical SAM protein, partial [Candidatus Omnitrophota bacterium]
MSQYVESAKLTKRLRLPLECGLDITYRCNNNCRHCWVSIPRDSEHRSNELTYDEIIKIVKDSRSMGCRRWKLSGGEPMLRDDFEEIFSYITASSAGYSLNTNGTLITPEIAKLMKRPGMKMVALYGATSDVHDYVTQRPGSFEETMRGLSYLREAGAGFIVQIVPMKSNFHQYKAMIELARTLSRHYRIGAAWLHLSACGDAERNASISAERLDPEDVVGVDMPVLGRYPFFDDDEKTVCVRSDSGRGPLEACILERKDFYVNPYGKASFCHLIQYPVLM